MKKTKKNEAALEELHSQIKKAFDKASDGRDEKNERFKKSYMYFTDNLPEKNELEISDYVEPVVRKAVEAVKPSLMNIFTENERNAVSFRPSVLVPTPLARMVDDAINRIFLRENDGYEIIERAITEAMVTGDVFLKYYIEEKSEEEEYKFENITSDDLAPILAEYPDTEIEENDYVQNPDGTLTGDIDLVRINRNVKIEFVPFSEIFVSGDVENIKDVRYICHRLTKTVGEMMELGYSKEDLAGAKTAVEDDEDLSTETLVNSRRMGTVDADDFAGDEMERPIFIYEHYVYSSALTKGKESKLYRVIATDSDILDHEDVDYIPFVHGVIERIPGSFWGVSFYDKFHKAQDSISRLMRLIEQQAMQNVHNRFLVIKGQYDRQSLLNSTRPGAVVEQHSPGAIAPFPLNQTPAAVESIIGRMTGNVKEDYMSAVGVDVTGANMSATAAAITANSADLKDKVIARVLAYTLFRPLFEGLYNIIRAEDLKIGEMPPQQDPVTGAATPPIPVTGAQLPKHFEFQIDVNTANDDFILANQLIQLGNTFAQWSQVQSPVLNPMTMIGIAKKITGLNDAEINEYFVIPQPSEEEMMMQQKQMADQAETVELQKDLLRAQVGNAAAITAKTEQEIQEMILDGEAKRKDNEQQNIIKLEALELKKRELEFEMETGQNIHISR